MAKRKRKKKCDTPNCLVHRWYPMIAKKMGEHACYWVDEDTGEVMIATGMKVLPELEVVEMDDECVREWVRVRCTCGNKATQRVDLLQSGKITSCPNCTANRAFGARN